MLRLHQCNPHSFSWWNQKSGEVHLLGASNRTFLSLGKLQAAPNCSPFFSGIFVGTMDTRLSLPIPIQTSGFFGFPRCFHDFPMTYTDENPQFSHILHSPMSFLKFPMSLSSLAQARGCRQMLDSPGLGILGSEGGFFFGAFQLAMGIPPSSLDGLFHGTSMNIPARKGWWRFPGIGSSIDGIFHEINRPASLGYHHGELETNIQPTMGM